MGIKRDYHWGYDIHDIRFICNEVQYIIHATTFADSNDRFQVFEAYGYKPSQQARQVAAAGASVIEKLITKRQTELKRSMSTLTQYESRYKRIKQ